MEKGRENWGRGGHCRKPDGATGRKILGALLLCMLAICLHTACGSADSKGSEMMQDAKDSASYNAGGGIYEEAATEDYGTELDGTGLLDERKLIQKVRLEVETQQFEQLMTSLETQIQDMDGYIESMETYNGSSYSDYSASRYAELTVRIPSGQLKSFLQSVSDISNVVRRYENVDDVTLSYVDMESRRNTLRTEQSRLLEFLDKAENVEEIIALEERLSEVRYQLESMESQLRTIDNLIDYSTITIHISEVRELTPVDAEEPSAWKRIADGFLKSLRDIGEGAVELLIWLLTRMPYLVIWAVVIACGVVFWKRMRAKRLRKKEEREREEQNRIQAQRARMQEWEAGAKSAGNEEKPEPKV